MALIVAFPGQGVDPIDLARILADADDDPLVALLRDVTRLEDFERIDLSDTSVAQPCIYTASLIAARAGAGDPRTCSEIVAVCGHSFGELAALAFAGAMSAEVGLRLVRRRAELCQQEQVERAGTMIVVMRLEEAEVEWVRRNAVASAGGVLEWAVRNGPGQFVLSGDAATAADALARIEALDGLGRALPIGGAFHSPLLAPAVDDYRTAVASSVTNEPVVPLVSCTTHRAVSAVDDLADALARALILPVDWPRTLDAAVVLGADRGLDVGPGRTLYKLAVHDPRLAFSALSPERSSRSTRTVPRQRRAPGLGEG